MKNFKSSKTGKKKKLTTLLTLGLVVAVILISFGISLFVNNKKTLLNLRAAFKPVSCPVGQCAGTYTCFKEGEGAGGYACCGGRWKLGKSCSTTQSTTGTKIPAGCIETIDVGKCQKAFQNKLVVVYDYTTGVCCPPGISTPLNISTPPGKGASSTPKPETLRKCVKGNFQFCTFGSNDTQTGPAVCSGLTEMNIKGCKTVPRLFYCTNYDSKYKCNAFGKPCFWNGKNCKNIATLQSCGTGRVCDFIKSANFISCPIPGTKFSDRTDPCIGGGGADYVSCCVPVQ
ncbi:MAG: hypothetical protein AAB441_04395 [Patescibacteria group bacterium]